MMRVMAVETRESVISGEREVRSDEKCEKNCRGKIGIWDASFLFICFSVLCFYIFIF
jgi:hypothetical protein